MLVQRNALPSPGALNLDSGPPLAWGEPGPPAEPRGLQPAPSNPAIHEPTHPSHVAQSLNQNRHSCRATAGPLGIAKPDDAMPAGSAALRAELCLSAGGLAARCGWQ